jgi:hypothetical protein
MSDEAVDDGTQRVAIFSRGRNSFASVLAATVDPFLILVSDLGSIYVWTLQGIAMTVPIAFGHPAEKGVGKMEVVLSSMLVFLFNAKPI